MQSKRPVSFNGLRPRTQELKTRNRKAAEFGNRRQSSHGKAIGFAVERSLRRKLFRSGTAHDAPPSSGASRTPAPRRPRRLHLIPAEFIHPFVRSNTPQTVRA
jgi:hypothetical protein